MITDISDIDIIERPVIKAPVGFGKFALNKSYNGTSPAGESGVTTPGKGHPKGSIGDASSTTASKGKRKSGDDIPGQPRRSRRSAISDQVANSSPSDTVSPPCPPNTALHVYLRSEITRLQKINKDQAADHEYTVKALKFEIKELREDNYALKFRRLAPGYSRRRPHPSELENGKPPALTRTLNPSPFVSNEKWRTAEGWGEEQEEQEEEEEEETENAEEEAEDAEAGSAIAEEGVADAEAKGEGSQEEGDIDEEDDTEEDGGWGPAPPRGLD